MAYTANADDALAPTLPVLAGTAAEEFRKIKEKMNNLFLASDYLADLQQQSLKAGLLYTHSLAPTANTGIMYGHAINITRNDSAAIGGSGVSAVAAQLTAIQGENVNAPGTYIFGAATEAWTSAVNSQAILIGLETSVISQYNDNTAALVGLDVVFKNRPDGWVSGAITADLLVPGRHYTVVTTGTTDFTLCGATGSAPGTFFLCTAVGTGTGTAEASVRQGLGANHYNVNSRGIQITSQKRSGAGEYSGWHKGITFEVNSIDSALIGGVVVPGLVIDMTNMGNPAILGAYNNPWNAYRHSSALALSEYMSITWDKLQFTRTYLDSFNTIMWLFAIGGDSTTPTNPTNVVGFDYTNNYLTLPTVPVAGAPGAATGSFIMRVNGVNRNVHFS